MHSETKHKTGLLLGAGISLIGLLFLIFLNINLLFSWIIMISGKTLMIINLYGYSIYQKKIKGKI